MRIFPISKRLQSQLPQTIENEQKTKLPITDSKKKKKKIIIITDSKCGLVEDLHYLV